MPKATPLKSDLNRFQTQVPDIKDPTLNHYTHFLSRIRFHRDVVVKVTQNDYNVGYWPLNNLKAVHAFLFLSS